MSGKFKAWLRVSPSPTTLTESSAIFKQLKSQGQIQAFRQALKSESTSRPSAESNSRLFYTTFAHEPLHLRKSFDVTVYHDLVDPKEADPYNIRGLQNRKPFPAPKTFSCILEKVEEETSRAGRQDNNPWHREFRSEKNHWFQTVLEETGAPPGIARGLSVVEDGSSGDGVRNELPEKSYPQVKKIEMNALMKLWLETVNQPTGQTTKIQQSKFGTVPSSQATDTHD